MAPFSFMAESDTESEEFLQEIDVMMNEYDELCLEEQETVDTLQKKAELAYYISNETDDTRKQWLKTGRDHALEASKLAPESVKVLRILCATTGRLAEESGMIDKIRLGFEFKDYLDRAISLDDGSDEDTTYELRHMRGRFIHAVETLGTIERTLAKGLGVVPKVNIKQAIQDLLKAQEVYPDFPENELLLGKCYAVGCDNTGAVYWLEKAASRNPDDSLLAAEYINEAKKLLRENYRK